jgi:hypothetical protein
VAKYYTVAGAATTVKVVSQTQVIDVQAVPIYTKPSQVYTVPFVPLDDWRAGKEAKWLEPPALLIEQLMGNDTGVGGAVVPFVNQATYVQAQDASGLLAGFMDFQVYYQPPDVIGLPLTETVRIPMTSLQSFTAFEVALAGRHAVESDHRRARPPREGGGKLAMPDGLFEPIPVTPRPFRPTFPGPPDDGDVITLPDPTPAPEPQPGPTPAPPPVIPEPPSAPTSPGALPDLGWLAALIVIFGLIALAKALVDFFNWLFRRMLGPLYPKSNRTPLTTKALLQPLSNHLGSWEQGIDAHLGLSFQKLASIETRLGRAIVAAAQTGYQVAVRVGRLDHHSRVQDHVAHAQGQRIASAQHTARHAVTQAETERKRSVAGEHSIQMQVNALTHHVTHVHGARTRATAAPDTVAREGRDRHLGRNQEARRHALDRRDNGVDGGGAREARRLMD